LSPAGRAVLALTGLELNLCLACSLLNRLVQLKPPKEKNMKKILVSIAIISLSLMASARSVDRTPVVATVSTSSGSEEGIKQIALLSDGRLQIVPEAGSVKTIQLSESALKRLVGIASSLSFAEVKSQTRMVVCEIMVMPSLSDLSVGKYNQEIHSFEGNQTRLVLTAQGCAFSKVALPTEEWAKETAAELRSALVILALNSLK
jgi:hypothetical protein